MHAFVIFARGWDLLELLFTIPPDIAIIPSFFEGLQLYLVNSDIAMLSLFSPRIERKRR
jgi:hypothetical protein